MIDLAILNAETTQCLTGEHALICECGDALRMVPRGDEWAYVSARTGNSTERYPNPLVEKYGWDGLAKHDMGAYSLLRARFLLGCLDRHHSHHPLPCTRAHERTVEVPECCGWPMRLAPQGWVCRINREAH